MVNDSSPSHTFDSTAPSFSESHTRDYWDEVGSEWKDNRPDRLWREYTDRLQIAPVPYTQLTLPTNREGEIVVVPGSQKYKTIFCTNILVNLDNTLGYIYKEEP